MKYKTFLIGRDKKILGFLNGFKPKGFSFSSLFATTFPFQS